MPYWGLVMGSGHKLYGTATYDAFQLTPSSATTWEKETIYQFTEGISGTIPTGNLVMDKRGNL